MTPKFDAPAFGFPDNNGRLIDNLVEYKFVEAKAFDPNSFTKNRKSLHHESRAAEGSFYVLIFRVPSAESQKLVITVKDGKSGKKDGKNVIWAHTDDNIGQKQVNKGSKSPVKSRPPLRRSVSSKQLRVVSAES